MMRAVMREFLFLLFIGNGESVLLERSGQKLAFSLGYEELSSLRPQTAASTWRVTAGRLQKLRLISKSWEREGVRFQLTKLGLETIAREFSLPPQEERTDAWLMCILAPQEAQKPQHAAARRVLTNEGYINLVPGLYIRLWNGYSGSLAEELQHLGFVPCFVPVNPRSAQPASLDSLLYVQTQQAAKKNRKFFKFGEDVASLLNELQKKNTLHAKDKQRVGTFLVSGLNHLLDLDPLQLVLPSSRSEMEQFVRSLDALMRRFLKE